LVHRRDACAGRNHAHPLEHFGLQQRVCAVSQKELARLVVLKVTPHSGDFEACVAILHFIDVLCEYAALLVLEVSKVNFDQKVNVAGVSYLGHRVVIPCKFFAINCGLKLEVLACLVAQGPVFRQLKSVNKGIQRQLLLRDKTHRDWLVELLQHAAAFQGDLLSVGPQFYKRVEALCMKKKDTYF
jgi:hypothetical protein